MDLFNLENMIVALSAIGSFLSIVAVGLPLVQKDSLGARLKVVAERRQELSRQQQAKFQQRHRLTPRGHVSLMKRLLEGLKLENLIASKAIRTKLAQAGWRGQNAAIIFAFTRIALPVVFSILIILVMTFTNKMDYSFPMKMLVLGGAAAIGFYLPGLIVSNTAQNRQKTMMRSFPDALDLMVICVESGLSIEAAFNKVSEEMAESAPELSEEIGLATAELAFLGDRRMAFDNLAERTGMAAIKSLVTALIQSEKYGTPVSLSLRVLSQENREARMAIAEKKAGALPAQLTVPMILFFLPVLFVVVLGPAIIQAMRNFH